MPTVHRKALRYAAALAGAVIAIALAAPPVLPAQQASAPLAALSQQTRSAIYASADSLRAEGLPGDALIAKAAEGLLKGETEDRIVAVVHRLAGDLRAAAAALGSDAAPGEIVAAAGALRAGASPDAVRQLRSAAGPSRTVARRPLTVALVVLGDLVSRGAPPAVAAGSVTSLLARHASDEDLQALRVVVERDIDAGDDPATAATTRSRALADSLAAGSAPRPAHPVTAPPHGARP
jgi:hypothetical protein